MTHFSLSLSLSPSLPLSLSPSLPLSLSPSLPLSLSPSLPLSLSPSLPLSLSPSLPLSLSPSLPLSLSPSLPLSLPLSLPPSSNLRITSWNCRSLSAGLPYAEVLAESSDILIISEHWLWPFEVHKFQNIRPDMNSLVVTDKRLTPECILTRVCGARCWYCVEKASCCYSV